MINLNGAPKSGTHALIKAVELLGLPCDGVSAQILRSPYAVAPKGAGAVFIYRHPRNALISRVRMERAQQVTPGLLITTMSGFCAEYMQYVDYLSDSETLCVRLENLIAQETTHQAIAAHIGRMYIANAHAALPGMTFSYNAAPSEWTTDLNWTQQVTDEWVANGGAACEAAFGYD
jgi:hypothetical protein